MGWNVVPATIGIIFLLLFPAFGRVRPPLIILMTVPFALGVGVWPIFLRGLVVSIPKAVGFIALAGLAAELAVVTLVYVDRAVAERVEVGRISTSEQLDEALMDRAVLRVRPKPMTLGVILAGLFHCPSERAQRRKQC